MDNFSSVGKGRFLFFLSRIQDILDKAASAENPALVVYTDDMRTPLFMLEALSRIYKKIYKHKKLKKLNSVFKELEDLIGQVDYYDGFYKEFGGGKKIPGLITTFTEEKRAEKLEDLNHFLKKENWLGKHKKRISKINKKLDKIEWLDEKKDAAAVLKVYQHEIEKVIGKYKIHQKEFTDIEKDVHELRRELRWLSIYPQALRGLIQLQPGGEVPDFLNKYLTPEIINSPFNKMPDGSGLQTHILLNQNYYFALSWMISELGKLKDSGLKIDLLKEGISEVYKSKKNVASLAYSLCDENQPTISDILNNAQNISNAFFAEDILDHIVLSGSGS